MSGRQILPSTTGTQTSGWVRDRDLIFLGAAIWMLGYAYPTVHFPYLNFREKWLPLIIGALWIAAYRFQLASALRPHINAGMALVLLWAAVSALWAPNAGFVLTQWICIVGASLLGLALSLAAWHTRRFEHLLTFATTALLLASLVAGLLFPGFGVHQEIGFELHGSWKGVASQKNALGQLAAIGLIVWTYRWAIGGNTTLSVLGVSLSLLMLVLSRSSTSMLGAMIACAVLLMQMRPMIHIGSNGGAMLTAVFVIVAPLAGIVAIVASGGVDGFAGVFGSLFGKDASFSGRTFIWAELIDEIGRHPWLGFGFSSFWGETGQRSAAAQAIVLKLGWPVPTGHNGYLDLVNELGLIGLGFFLVFLVIHVRALHQLAHWDYGHAALHRCLFVYIMIANLSETGWFHPMLMTHVLAMYSSVEVSRQLFEHRLRSLRREQQGTRPPAPPTPRLVSGLGRRWT